MTAAGVAPTRAQLYALLGVMLLFWSANFIFVKFALYEMPPMLVIALRTILAGVLMWPVYALARERLEPAVRGWTVKDVPALTSLGVLGVTGNQVLFTVGLSMTSVAHASVICAMAPLFVLFGATLMHLEHFTAPKVTGMLVAAAGITVLQFGRHHSSATLAGDLIVLASQLVFAAFTVLSKRIAAQFGTITLNAFAFVCGGLALLPIALWDMARMNLMRVSAVAWIAIVYMALFSSTVGYLIYTYALRYLPASRVSSVSYLQPVVATVLAVFFLREHPGIMFAGAAALVIGGVYVAEQN